MNTLTKPGRRVAACLAALAASCMSAGVAQAGDGFSPQLVPSAVPIDVHNIHIVETTQLRKVRLDIDPHTFVGAITFNWKCSSAVNVSLDAYQAVARPDPKDESKWSFNLATMSRAFAVEMEKAGYPRYDPDLSLFEARLGSDADYQIGTTFTKLEFNKCGNHYLNVVKGSAYVAARFELYSPRLQKAVFDKVVEASYRIDEDRAIEDRDFNFLLLKQLVDNLLADPDFAAAYRRSGATAPAPVKP